MDQYHLSDENFIQSEMHIPGFSESQGLNCSDTLNLKLCPDTRDITYTGLSSLDMDPSLSAADMANDTLEDNLDALSLYSVKDCDFVKLLDESDFGSQPSLCELGLPVPAAPKEVEQEGKSNSGSARKGKHQHSSPQNPVLDCSLCGKVFSSASSLSKHNLTHSQERKYICKICSKAFKRQDHLSGHMLTHQKTKPFMCIEQGCNKSYCDHRSLLRHYEMQHGLSILKEATCDEDACKVSSPSHDAFVQRGQGSLRMERLAVHSESKSPNPVLPNRDLLKCIVSSIVNQKLPSTPASSAGDLKGSLQSCSSAADKVSCIPSSTTALFEATSDSTVKEHYSCQKNATSSNVYAIINPGNLSVITPGENIVTSLTDTSLLSESQFPLETTGLDYWPNSTLPCFPLFRGQKISANSSHQSSSNFQWIRNMPVCTKSKGNSVYINHNPSVAAQNISGGFPGPSHAFDSFAQMYECPDAVSFALLKTQGEISGETKLSSFEEAFRPTKRQECDIDSCHWQNIQKHSVLQNDANPHFRQLFMESSVNQEHLQVQQHLLQMFTKSQHILSHTQVVAPSQKATSEVKQAVEKPLQNVLQEQQQADVIHSLLEHTQRGGSPMYMQKTLTQYQKDVLSVSEEQGQIGRQQAAVTLQSSRSLSDPFINSDSAYSAKQTRPLKGCVGFKDIDNPSQPQTAVCDKTLGNSTYGKSRQRENNTSVYSNKERNEGYCKGTSGKLHSSSGRPRRLSSVRKEKLKFDLSCTASPSQVAMASFSLPGTSPSHVTEKKHKLTIFNRIQGGNIYSLTNAVREENLSAGCNNTSGVPADGNKYASGFVCKTCGQLFYTEKGLNSHMCFQSEQWHSPPGKMEQQVYNAENLNPQKLSLRPIGDGNTPSEIKKPLEDVKVAPLVIPVSVPVTAMNQQTRNKVNEKESQDEKDLRKSLSQKKRKRQTRPKSLFIPPPPPLCAEMQPAMMGGCHESNLRSPVYMVDHLLRDLFQNSPYTPPPMLSPIREGSGLYFNTLCSSSTNAGPNKLYSTILGRMDGDFGFCLVKDNTKISIKPHINIGNRFQAEIPNLQDRAFLENDEHAASLVWKPWGDIATNQETQDRVTGLLNVACSSVMPGGGTNLELALHCLHEAQGNILEALEMLLFRGPQKAPSHPLADYRYAGSDVWTPVEKQLFKKAFCLHKKDFYLIQKKIACSPKKMHGYLPRQDLKIKSKNYKKASHKTYSPACSQRGTPDQPGSTDYQGAFPCKECERVFDKIKSRNAHMKCHRVQEQMEPLINIKWPIKH
ncbi:zinc finger protein 541 isoform X2 [Chelonia mydas]|uniref:zinc finger protein 541 isoform X2 n=1 Tax=Chelonia mydas TaxID=8469 RepID=UPI001CA9293F|nr:zinc finger protein 541 isoform X2 [Chelonia mydas]XP_043390688.1 zinc finger protein 541 isoform X2 [Chelonia mydas]